MSLNEWLAIGLLVAFFALLMAGVDSNWQGTFAVEFVRGAAGPAPVLAWGLE